MKRSIHIDAPVKKVFDAFKDPTTFLDLGPAEMRVEDMKITKEGVGTYTSWQAKVAGVPMRGFDVLTDVVPNKHITERSSNPLVGTWHYGFKREGSGTKLTMEHHPESFWRFPPLSNLVELVVERMSGPYMTRVKEAIEAEGA